MSQENVELVMQFFAAASKRDLETLARLQTPDAVWTSTYAPPYGGEYRGAAGIELLSRLIASFDVSDVKLEHVVAQGDLVVLILRERMLAKATGKSAINHAAVALKVRDGKIASVDMFGDSLAIHEILQPA